MAGGRTYGAQFMATLEEWITDGGDVSRIVTLANVYQGADQTARQLMFKEWLEATNLTCGGCGVGFKNVWEEVEEEDEIMCGCCIEGYLGPGP